MAGKLVESLYEPFDPAAFNDSYRDTVLKLIEAKAKGKEVKLPEIEATEETADLIGALEASLKSSAGRTRKRARRSTGSSKGRSSQGRRRSTTSR